MRFYSCRWIISALIIFCNLTALEVYYSKEKFIPGDIILVTVVRTKAEKYVKVYENGKRRILYMNKDNPHRHIFNFYTGFDIKTPLSAVTFRMETAKGKSKKTFKIHKKPVKTGKVTFTSTKKKNLTANRSKAAKENSFFHNFFRHENKVQYWRGPWISPVHDFRISSAYGKLRTYNNGRKSYHRGVDFRGKIGTKVMAVNRGRVVYAGRKRIRGNIVVIDHGCSVYTEYWHLSQINVRRGQMVSKGQLIGKIGDTGSTAGPHLHWGVRIRQAPVNGLELLKIPSKLIKGQVKPKGQ